MTTGRHLAVNWPLHPLIREYFIDGVKVFLLACSNLGLASILLNELLKRSESCC